MPKKSTSDGPAFEQRSFVQLLAESWNHEGHGGHEGRPDRVKIGLALARRPPAAPKRSVSPGDPTRRFSSALSLVGRRDSQTAARRSRASQASGCRPGTCRVPSMPSMSFMVHALGPRQRLDISSMHVSRDDFWAKPIRTPNCAGAGDLRASSAPWSFLPQP